MELLSSVHWIITKCGGHKKQDIKDCIHDWSERKKEMFDEDVIYQAYDRLKEDGFITEH
jgi:hypothetical protein